MGALAITVLLWHSGVLPPQHVTPVAMAAAPVERPSKTHGGETIPFEGVVQPVGEKHGIGLPIAGLKAKDIQDTFNHRRGGGSRAHEATDILSPRGSPVLAMVDGTVKRLFTSKPGGLTIYQFDPEGVYCYYYAHLDRYAEGLKEGMHVKRGDPIGYVGTTGNADPGTPHLHLAIFKIGPEKRWWEGTPLNPYPILMEALSSSR